MGGGGGGASPAAARRYAKEKQEAEQRERQQLRIVGQRRGAARVGDTGQGGHQVQGVIGGVEALGIAQAANGTEQALGGEVQSDVGGEAGGGGEGEGDAETDEGECGAGADDSSRGE